MNSTADNRFIELHKQVAALQLQNDALRQQLAAAQAEARELREKLGRMVEIREAAVDVMGNALRLNGGGFHVYQRPLERLIAALSRPAAEQLDDWPESRIDVIGQNGNDGDHYADAERESLPPPLIDEEDYDEPFETAAGARVEADWDLARELGKERSDG